MQYEYSPIQLAEVTDFSFLKDWDTIRIIPEGYDEVVDRLIEDQHKTTKNCIICSRPGAAMQGVEHDGWCWGCVRNRMEGRGIDSYGNPFPSYPRPWAEEG